MKITNMLIVGFGTMTGAMVDGWLRAGMSPQSFTVYHPRGKDVPDGVQLVTEWPDTAFDAVLLGVKPYMGPIRPSFPYSPASSWPACARAFPKPERLCG
jgi:pyrroline-5-carboxylate reductase